MAATAWCGTLHLDTEEFDGETFLKQLVEAKRIAYGIGQIERCPTTGRLHFQFYIQAHRTQALSWVPSISQTGPIGSKHAAMYSSASTIVARTIRG